MDFPLAFDRVVTIRQTPPQARLFATDPTVLFTSLSMKTSSSQTETMLKRFFLQLLLNIAGDNFPHHSNFAEALYIHHA